MGVRRAEPGSARGSVLTIAIMLMFVMFIVAGASLKFVESQQKRGLEQRQRETAFNLAEAVLLSQGFVLAGTWPGNVAAGTATPTTCTSATVQSMCPNPNTLAAANSASPASANFTDVDASSDVTWTTRIRDDGGPIADAYVRSSADATQTGTNVVTGAAYSCPGPCRWDANGDLKLWIQGRAVVRGRARSLVALLRREEFSESFAKSGITAGSFETTNNGNKAIIDATGSQVVVRCTTTGASCTDYQANKGQVLPATIVRDASTPPAMSAAQIARFKAAAQSANPSTYFTTCPASLAGGVVFVDLPSAATNCSDSNNATYNSAADPGIVIMPRGSLSMKGSLYGLIYMVNEQNSAEAVLTMQANSELFGGLAIDGPGRLVVGQASGPRPTITYMPNAFNSLSTYGTTGLVQNTWRELPSDQ
jgi:Tfp pilus assembly protein PilX